MKKIHPVLEFIIILCIILLGVIASNSVYALLIVGKDYTEITNMDFIRYFFSFFTEYLIPFLATFLCVRIIEHKKTNILKILVICLFISLFISYISTIFSSIGARYGISVLYEFSKISLFAFPILKAFLITVFLNLLNFSAVDSYIYDKKMYCPIFKHLILLLFTFGIWRLVWIYRTTKYLNCTPDEEQRNPATKLLLCMFVPFYSIYWTYKSALYIDKLAKSVSVLSDLSVVCLILELFVPIVPPLLMQDKINKIITSNLNISQ